MKKGFLAAMLSLTLLVGAAVGGSVAWLTTKTEEVTNTFTAGDIDITLNETTGNEYKMIPGVDIAKDPIVTVEGGSEKCWLFVQVDKTNGFDSYMDYEIADGWELVSGTTNVYARVVDAANTDQAYHVIKDDKITVKTTLTKTELEAANASNPTMSFTAYAVQHAKFVTAAAAWAEAPRS